jgi:hypothetical protein
MNIEDLYEELDRLEFLKPYKAAESLLAKDPKRYEDFTAKIEAVRQRIKELNH